MRATTYEEGKTDTTWFRVEIANSIMDSPRLKESLVRKLLKIRRFQGEEPQTFGQKLNGTNFIMYQTQISLLLGLDDRSIVSICKTVCPKYGPPPTKKFKFSSEITKPVVVHDGKSSKENVSSTQSKEKPSSLASPASRVSESPEIRFPLDYLLPIKKLNKCHELTYQNSAANPNECPSASSTHHRESQDEPARPPAVPAPESTSMLPIVPVSIPADPPATISIAARPDDCPPASLSHRRESPDEPARPPAVSAPESTSMLPIVSVSVPGDPPATISIAARPDDGPPASSIHRRESLDEPTRPLTVPAPESTSMGPVISVAIPVDLPTPVSGAITTTTASLTSLVLDQPLDTFAASIPATPMPRTEQVNYEQGPTMSAFLSNFTTTTTMANSSMPIVSFDGLQYIAFNSANGQDFIDLTSNGSITESNPNLNSISVPMETDTVNASGDHGSSEEYRINGLVAQRFPAYSPTPKSQVVTELSLDLSMRAEKLLKH